MTASESATPVTTTTPPAKALAADRKKLAHALDKPGLGSASSIAVVPDSALVSITDLGFGSLLELLEKLREFGKLFADGNLNLDTIGNAGQLLLGLFGMAEEGKEFNLLLDQTYAARQSGIWRPVLEDANGSEIRLRRLLAARFLPDAGFATQATENVVYSPLPDHVAFARIASEIEQVATSGFTTSAVGGKPELPPGIDPKMIPPIVWQIGGMLLIRLIERLLKNRAGQ